MDLRRFGTAGKQPVEEKIQALGDLHGEPYLPTRGADLDGNTKHQRGATITLLDDVPPSEELLEPSQGHIDRA